MNSSPEQTVRRFLLGIASEEEECRVEEAVLAGELDDFFLLNAEDELIDDYLLGSMTREERRAFSANFLSAKERRQKLEFAARLIECARKEQVEELSSGWKLALRDTIRAVLSWKQAALLATAVSVLLAALAGFDQTRLRRQTQIASETQNELTRLQAALAAGNSESSRLGKPSTAALSSPQDGADRMPVLEFAPSTRSVYPVLLRVPAQAQFIRVDVKLSLPLAMKYREVLVASNGDRLWSQEFPALELSTAPQSTIVLPTPILPQGLYHFQIERAFAEGRFEQSADYVFRVVKE